MNREASEIRTPSYIMAISEGLARIAPFPRKRLSLSPAMNLTEGILPCRECEPFCKRSANEQLHPVLKLTDWKGRLQRMKHSRTIITNHQALNMLRKTHVNKNVKKNGYGLNIRYEWRTLAT